LDELSCKFFYICDDICGRIIINMTLKEYLKRLSCYKHYKHCVIDFINVLKA